MPDTISLTNIDIAIKKANKHVLLVLSGVFATSALPFLSSTSNAVPESLGMLSLGFLIAAYAEDIRTNHFQKQLDAHLKKEKHPELTAGYDSNLGVVLHDDIQ